MSGANGPTSASPPRADSSTSGRARPPHPRDRVTRPTPRGPLSWASIGVRASPCCPPDFSRRRKRMSTSPKRLAALASAALAVAGLTVLAPQAQANPGGSGLVISEVYGAGGNAGAVYNADFIELYNPAGANVSVSGMYVHYRSASGTSGGVPFALTGSVPAHGTYLVQMSATGANGVALPTPDAGPAGFAMAAAGGQAYLLSNGTAIVDTGNMAGKAGVVDMVGASGSSSFETGATTGAATATSSLN